MQLFKKILAVAQKQLASQQKNIINTAAKQHADTVKKIVKASPVEPTVQKLVKTYSIAPNLDTFKQLNKHAPQITDYVSKVNANQQIAKQQAEKAAREVEKALITEKAITRALNTIDQQPVSDPRIKTIRESLPLQWENVQAQKHQAVESLNKALEVEAQNTLPPELKPPSNNIAPLIITALIGSAFL